MRPRTRGAAILAAREHHPAGENRGPEQQHQAGQRQGALPGPADVPLGLGSCDRLGLGARVVGGCCGTEPHHIAAIAEVVPSLKPRTPDHAVREIEVRVSDPHPDRDTQLSQLGHRLKEGKFVTYDLKSDRSDPSAVGTTEMADAIARRLKRTGVGVS